MFTDATRIRHNLSIEDIDNMIPYERDVYITLMNNKLKQIEQSLGNK